MRLFRQAWFWCTWVGLVLLSLVWAAYQFNWPGTGFQGKTMWDWLSLLIIPLALALIALFFNQINTRAERQIAKERYEQDKEAAKKRYERDQAIAEARYKQDQQIALDKQREDLLQAYLDCMSDLLLEKGLRTAQADAEVRIFARARTLNILTQLDARRVGYVFRFLREAGLANASDPIVNLQHGDLSRVNWSGANLSGANLFQTNLSNADLSNTDFNEADLRDSDLSEANLSNTYLGGADLSCARLMKARLRNALLISPSRITNLQHAKLSLADLADACLSSITFANGKRTYVDLSNADLNGADFRRAQIHEVNLTPEQIAQAIWD